LTQTLRGSGFHHPLVIFRPRLTSFSSYFFSSCLCHQRVLGALKYTVFTLVIMIVLFLLGFFLNPGEGDPTDPSWYLGLLNASSKQKHFHFLSFFLFFFLYFYYYFILDGIKAACFIIACLTVLGIFVFVTYTVSLEHPSLHALPSLKILS